MTKSLYLKVPIVGLTDEERTAVRGILKSLISCVFMDLEEKSTRNYDHMMKVRLTSDEKKFLMRTLEVYMSRHRDKELLEESLSAEVPADVVHLIEFYGGRNGFIPNRE